MEAHGFRALIAQAQAGDAEAQHRLLAVIRPHLERVARAYADPARAEESASDLIQEASLRAWQRLDRFRAAADDEQTLALFRAWIDRLARNVGLNRRRDGRAKRRRPLKPFVSLDEPADRPASDPADGGPSPSANLRAGEQTRLVLEALERLPDETDRRIMRLRFFEGQSLRQIADRLPLPYDHVRDRFQKTLDRLRGVLGDLQ
jgi:RNA polymerase sigma factor (sigma-70 family)